MIDKAQIAAMRQGGKKLAQILKKVATSAKPQVSLAYLDTLAEKLILQSGGEPGFKYVPDYRWATCINVNQGVVHGVPHAHNILKSGDIVSIDMGLYFKDFHTDTATTVLVGQGNKSTQQFLKTGQQALKKAIQAATSNNRVGHISKSMQQVIQAAGYQSARGLTGHGIGKALHQPPMVPCYLTGPIDQTVPLQVGMTLAIEVIYFEGDWRTKKQQDDWTLVSQDGKLAGLFEETILVTSKGPKVLTI